MKTLGVVIARMQVPTPHDGHEYLIDTVLSQDDEVLVIFGETGGQTTAEDPLSFSIRNCLLKSIYGDLIRSVAIRDTRDNDVWSQKIDLAIATYANEKECDEVTIYGSRDSFKKSYSGCFNVEEIEPIESASGTEIREDIKNNPVEYMDGRPDIFAAGIIYGAVTRLPTVYSTVDMIILDENNENILLGRKPGETKFRLLGGFASPDSDSFEEDAAREVMEESGIEVTHPFYIGSTKINDVRYRRGPDCVKTLLFVMKYVSGEPKGADDIEEVKWVPVKNVLDEINPIHRPLIEMYFDWCVETRTISVTLPSRN